MKFTFPRVEDAIGYTIIHDSGIMASAYKLDADGDLQKPDEKTKEVLAAYVRSEEKYWSKQREKMKIKAKPWFRGYSWVGILNQVLFQWFFVRLEVEVIEDREIVAAAWLYPVVPLTGWWNSYWFLGKGSRRWFFFFRNPLHP